ncbi:MAG: response regulator [Xanthobacteraceae bacterium]|nr:response regulator [Xanthobacteraceae bacterium]
MWNDEPENPAAEASAGPPTVVLLVEDEPLLRELTATMIDEAGFTALEANTADDALALLEARSDIALLFTDIDMPGSMDGLELARLACERWPAIKTLVASGKVRPSASELPPNSVFLAKPYRGAALIAQLRSMAGRIDAKP